MGRRGGRSGRRGRGTGRSGGQGASENNATHESRRSGASARARGRGGRKKQRKQIPFDPEKHFLPDALPERAYDSDPISGEPIDDIFSAITHPATGKPARIESVIEQLTESEELGEDERIAYIGRGAFGIVRMTTGENGRPLLEVRKRIQYEDGHGRDDWRRELAPGISRDYPPEPEPLSNLYTPEEIASFPRFDGTPSSYVTRGN